MTSAQDRFAVLDTSLHAVTMQSAISGVTDLIDAGGRGYVTFCTVSSTLNARKDRAVAEATIHI